MTEKEKIIFNDIEAKAEYRKQFHRLLPTSDIDKRFTVSDLYRMALKKYLPELKKLKEWRV
jgi:hypothetical protein